MVEGVASPDGPLLSLEAIEKSFGPVHALRGVSLEIRSGEVLALVGENGAGKSTLMKVLSGAHQPDRGVVRLDGEVLALSNPLAARRAGIAMIYQELTLAPHLTVEENVTLGLEKKSWGFVRSRAAVVREALELLGHQDIAPERLVGSLTIARQQVVEIARAIVSEARIVIMDEPTSSLTDEDKEALFRVIRKLKNEGIAVVYISHFLDEVDAVADRYAVLRDGEIVGAGSIAEATSESLVEQMIGRTIDEMYPQPTHAVGETVLRVRGLSGSPLPCDVSFDLGRGEIFGIFGLVGAGRTELVRCLFGLDRSAGAIELASQTRQSLSRMQPARALRDGLDLLSENRKEEGLAQNLTIAENTTLSAIRKTSRFGFVNLRSEQTVARQAAERLGIRCAGTRQKVSELSGGNQQKVALARMIHHDSEIFLMDEPTRGIDVGSKHEIYELMHTLAEEGKSVIVISSYLPELLGTCHTVAVMHRGALSAKRAAKEWSERDIMVFATTGKTPSTNQDARPSR